MTNLKEILIKDLEEYQKNNVYDGINVSFNTEDNISKGIDGDFVAHISRDGAYNFEFFITNDTEYPITIVCTDCPDFESPKFFMKQNYTLKEFEKSNMHDCINLHPCYEVIHCINDANKSKTSNFEKLKDFIELFVDNRDIIKHIYDYLTQLRDKRFKKNI